MKNLIIFPFFFIVFTSCNQKKKTENTISKVVHSESKITRPNQSQTENNIYEKQDVRINLDETLKDEQNDYLASLSNGVLDLCCYDLIDVSESVNYSKFTEGIEIYNSTENKTDTINLYKFKGSYLKKYFNKNPRVQKLDLVSGKITDNSILYGSTIKIGMNKNELLELIFKPSNLFKIVNQLTISENELGEAFTIYKFENEKLKEILFDSTYEWIDKDLKNN